MTSFYSHSTKDPTTATLEPFLVLKENLVDGRHVGITTDYMHSHMLIDRLVMSVNSSSAAANKDERDLGMGLKAFGFEAYTYKEGGDAPERSAQKESEGLEIVVSPSLTDHLSNFPCTHASAGEKWFSKVVADFYGLDKTVNEKSCTRGNRRSQDAHVPGVRCSLVS